MMAQQEMKFQSAYGPKIKVSLDFEGGETRAKQAHRDECDINMIMAKFVKTGVMDHQQKHQESYGFATSIELHEALSTVAKANSMFEDLPSSIRTKFHNQPGEFLDFVQDPENTAELVELGLATAKVEIPVEEPKGKTAEPKQATEPPPADKIEPVKDQKKSPERD